jgi:hypothetical protein
LHNNYIDSNIEKLEFLIKYIFRNNTCDLDFLKEFLSTNFYSNEYSELKPAISIFLDDDE